MTPKSNLIENEVINVSESVGNEDSQPEFYDFIYDKDGDNECYLFI